MGLYCGIDLHSTNHVIVVIDEKDGRKLDCRIGNDIAVTLEKLNPYKRRLKGVAVESTFNWYWLVDGLQEAGYPVVLANPAAMEQYGGLKATNDADDAWWLAHMLRLGILPTGYIYPRERRAVRDLMRQRARLVRQRAQILLSIQGLFWRETGRRVKSNVVQSRRGAQLSLDDPYLDQALSSTMSVLGALKREVKAIERRVFDALEEESELRLLKTVPGIGDILGMTILLESGDIGRFAGVGQYASYCRCVKSERLSNGKKKGEGNRKAGNKYLSWAFAEGAHFMVRYDPSARRYYERKRRKRNSMVAIRTVAHKLARACYYIQRDRMAYEPGRLFAMT